MPPVLNLSAAALLALSTLAPGAELPPPEQVTAVPAELREQLERHVTRHPASPERRLERLVDFVFTSDDGLALQYGNDSTLTIEQSFRARRANCLSFTLLFVALARHAGLDAYVQETDQVLAWFEQGGTVYNSGHVNAGVRIGYRRRTVDIDRSIVMMRHPPRAISDQRALAHYYNNRGAELMSAGQMAAAREHMHMAIRLAPDHVGAWNNLGVLLLRQGELKASEDAYRTALERDPLHAATLANFVNLYRRIGDQDRLVQFQQRLHKAQLKDPFHQFLLALNYEERGDYTNAIVHYKRAIRIHDKEHRFYFGLARAYMQQGDSRRARRALAKARDVSGDEHGVYQTKLDRLQASQR
jgi:Flp pilus assembly protein TadD